VGAVAARVFVVWPAKAVGGATRAAVRHGGATVGRVGKRAYRGVAYKAEERRAHGHRAVVRDLSQPGGGRPMSLPQVSAHLLGLETARAREEGRPDPVWALRLTPAYRERVTQPWPLTRRERWALQVQGHNPDDVWQRHQAIAAAVQPPALEPETDPSPPTTSVAAVGGGRRPVDLDRITQGGTTVIEPSNFDDLANPAIEQENWQEELPQHFRAAQQMVERAREGVSGFAEYHRAALTRDDIIGAIDEALSAMDSVSESFKDAANRAEEWVNSMQLPNYEKAG